MMPAPTNPTVTVAIPVLNEARHIEETLATVAAQTYENVVEVLVVDGGSSDETCALAGRHPGLRGPNAVTGLRGPNAVTGVRVLHNPRRIQAAALNIALAEAQGEIVVRVDGHCHLEPTYVERCVDALERTGAAMVGGAMRPVGQGWLQEGIAAAMTSPLGVGPARFHVGGPAGWVDTVYLGAYRTALARRVGGYREDVGVNEDAEFAIRMRVYGGIWFDPSIRSTYTPRPSIRSVAKQFYRYGRSRAATVRRHPASLSPRQLAAPALLAGLVSPWRGRVLMAYGAIVAGAGAWQLTKNPRSAAGFTLSLPAMHLPWAVGFVRGLARRRPRPPVPATDAAAGGDGQPAAAA